MVRMEKTKRFKKRYWVYITVAFLVVLFILTPVDEEKDLAGENNWDVTNDQVEETTGFVDIEEEGPKPEGPKPEGPQQEESIDTGALEEMRIEAEVRTVIKELDDVNIQEIKVNEHFEGGYIALVYLAFDRKNTAKTTKQMIELYNNQIGTGMAGTDDLVELTTFWEVPYLYEGDNIAKANMSHHEGEMYMEDEWFNGLIFN